MTKNNLRESSKLNGPMTLVWFYATGKSYQCRIMGKPFIDTDGEYTEEGTKIVLVKPMSNSSLGVSGEYYVEWNTKKKRWEFMDGFASEASIQYLAEHFAKNASLKEGVAPKEEIKVLIESLEALSGKKVLLEGKPWYAEKKDPFNDPEGKKMIDAIEDTIESLKGYDGKEPSLQATLKGQIKNLKDKFGFNYKTKYLNEAVAISKHDLILDFDGNDGIGIFYGEVSDDIDVRLKRAILDEIDDDRAELQDIEIIKKQKKRGGKLYFEFSVFNDYENQ